MPSYEEVTQRVGSLRSMTGVTEAECTALLPHVEPACVIYMRDRSSDGQPRTSRRYSTYENCPLPTMADTRLFILSYLKHNPIQEMPGQLFAMSQSHANTWIHLLHPVLNQALADQQLLPARTADDLAAILARQETEGASTSPLLYRMGPNDRSSVPKIQKTSKSITVARRSVTRLKTCL